MIFRFLSSPSEKEMLASDQDTQVLYETCASKECSKDCYSEVSFLWLQCATYWAWLFRYYLISQMSCYSSVLLNFHSIFVLWWFEAARNYGENLPWKEGNRFTLLFHSTFVLFCLVLFCSLLPLLSFILFKTLCCCRAHFPNHLFLVSITLEMSSMLPVLKGEWTRVYQGCIFGAHS